MLVGFVVALLFSFVFSNALLVKTADALSLLEQDHQNLEESRELYKTEVDSLADSLHQLESERDVLQLDSNQAYEVREHWQQSLFSLEEQMGLPRSEAMNLERGRILQAEATERLFMLRSIPNGSPLKEGRVTDRYGMRTHPVTGERKKHNGVDYKAASGTPIFSTADGAVEYAGYHKKSGYGNLLIIDHHFGFKTYYGHLKKLNVRTGSVIRKGQLVAYSGNTGISTGPHLHYEVRYLFKTLDPKPFVDWGMDNYEIVFNQVKGIAWDSLKEMNPMSQLADSTIVFQ